MKLPKVDVRIIGGGIAGCEAAYQLAKRGMKVELIEMRPIKQTPVHKTDTLAEIVHANFFASDAFVTEDPNSAGARLKAELIANDSLIATLSTAFLDTAILESQAQAQAFSQAVQQTLEAMENIHITHQIVTHIDTTPTILATGPMTDDSLLETLTSLFGTDAIMSNSTKSLMIHEEDIDLRRVVHVDDYQGSWLRFPMNDETFEKFYQTLQAMTPLPIPQFEQKSLKQAPTSIEAYAQQGRKALLAGPLSSQGTAGCSGLLAKAVVQCKEDQCIPGLYALVGFETRLRWSDQRTLIATIPGLENATLHRYGVMHRNRSLCAPKVLNAAFQSYKHPHIFVAGQLSGVDGHLESAASGLMAGVHMYHYLKNETITPYPRNTIMGALGYYIAHANTVDFQPIEASLALLSSLVQQS